MLRTSAEVQEIAAALAICQGKLVAAKKEAPNAFFKNKFADIAAVFAVARAPMAETGLAVVQAPLIERETGFFGIETRIFHKSGQWFANELWCKPKSFIAVDIGSAETYLRRYGFLAIMGIVADDDDDGTKASSLDTGKQLLDEKKAQRQADAAAVRAGQAAVTNRPATPVAAKGTYQNDAHDWQILQRTLAGKEVPEAWWDEIALLLYGKNSTELDAIIASVSDAHNVL